MTHEDWSVTTKNPACSLDAPLDGALRLKFAESKELFHKNEQKEVLSTYSSTYSHLFIPGQEED